ncbi:hypothetical protein SKAU_G00247570 [Synaphobranchus kaupii]|uniref:Uncharacterized protein n=1 Tax=Synaphobranchus kaupii TaxID=118154 RepID=A0A9Q1IRK4_SYNKA|nr:hypothetical protein SKAU_G00247570 [Synaphobranchus kaupii]
MTNDQESSGYEEPLPHRSDLQGYRNTELYVTCRQSRYKCSFAFGLGNEPGAANESAVREDPYTLSSAANAEPRC